jgi:hypothetical protein
MCLTSVIRPEKPAPKGQESLVQSLPWVSRNKRFALKGPEMPAIRFTASEPILAVPGDSFRANWAGGNYPGSTLGYAFLVTLGQG